MTLWETPGNKTGTTRQRPDPENLVFRENAAVFVSWRAAAEMTCPYLSISLKMDRWETRPDKRYQPSPTAGRSGRSPALPYTGGGGGNGP